MNASACNHKNQLKSRSSRMNNKVGTICGLHPLLLLSSLWLKDLGNLEVWSIWEHHLLQGWKTFDLCFDFQNLPFENHHSVEYSYPSRHVRLQTNFSLFGIRVKVQILFHDFLQYYTSMWQILCRNFSSIFQEVDDNFKHYVRKEKTVRKWGESNY